MNLLLLVTDLSAGLVRLVAIAITFISKIGEAVKFAFQLNVSIGH